MAAPTRDMPFLDHLEELRQRILRSLGAVVVGFGVGLWLVQRFQLVTLLKQPIAPYLTDGKLVVTSPTDPVLIVVKLGFLVGLVFASPIIIWQIWAFVAPALYEREKRALVPSLFVGLGLFLTGAAVAYALVIPQALRVLFSFQNEAIAPFITYDAYFGFVLQVVLALGISFELPLVIIILAWLGVVTPAGLGRFRRYAVVLSFIAGAVLSPGADLLSMVMMTVPLIVLYEVGYAGAVVIERRRRAAAIAGVVLLLLCPGWAEAQEPVRADTVRADTVVADTAAADTAAADTVAADTIVIDSAAADSARLRSGQALDSATASRLGLPTAPTRSFAQPDSVVSALLARPGYTATRYRADSATFFAEEKRIVLEGEAMTERQGTTLEADSISFREASCLLNATGDPRLFDRGQVLVGSGIRYNTCNRRGVVSEALTNFQEGGTVWFLRGNVAQDSSSSRIYAASSDITSCDLPTAHYHFAAREVKWISRNVLVARPVVLYLRDVPLLWLPFIFQDMRPGRRSGILVPQFGLNDIVRPSRSYNRQITNIGYYWAPNDYIDLTARLDWFSNRYLQYGVSGQYRWIDRFLDGRVSLNRQHENGGGSSISFRWDHRQTFDLSTTLNFNVNYVSQSFVIDRNAVDPTSNTREITSAANFTKRYNWGQLTLGGNRRQSLTDNSVRQQLPSIQVSPKPLDIGRDITWSPALSLTNDQTSRTPLPDLLVVRPDGGLDTLDQTGSTRVTALNFDSPLRLGSFNWRNGFRMVDRVDNRRDSVRVREPDLTTPDPNDSVDVYRVFTGDFSTELEWDTGINLPILFRSTWKLQPTVGIANVAPGAFAVRNRATNGDWVLQSKRLRFALSSSPTLFAFLPGLGPLSRIRHSVNPRITWQYAPAAGIPEEYARAVAQTGQPLNLRANPTQTISVSLSQTFEGKLRSPDGDTTAANARKLRLLSINTSAFTYDFEQAKRPERTGWVTPSLTNSFLSDLLPGFNLSVTHSLWEGEVGREGTKFDPFLQAVSASFAVSENTFRSVGRLFGLGADDERREAARVPDVVPTSYVDPFGRQPGSFFSSSQAPVGQGRPFTANVNYTLSRSRPVPGQAPPPANQNIGFSTSFSPTPFWALSWSTQFNVTANRFESHIVRLERDLHEWRAGFNFTRNANGNFAFYFSIYLSDLPDLKFDYNQTTLDQ